MLAFRRKQRPLLGIDIGSTAIKLVELGPGAGQGAGAIRAEALALEPLAPGAVVDKKIADVSKVGDALKAALRRCRTRTKRAAVAVAGSAVITKVLSLSGELSDAEMEAQIQLEADQYVPYPLEEVNLDFDVLGPTEGTAGMVDVLLAASRQENVDDRVAALELAGLSAEIVDIESNAIETACGLLADPLTPQPARLLGVADVGSTTTTLHVLREGQNIYTREQAFGAQHMLDDVQRRDGLTQREALERLQAASARAELRAEVLEPFQEALARQLGRALQFFYSSSTFSRVDELLLTGGASVIPGLDAAVGERLAIPIRVADPLAEVALSENLDLDLIRLHRGSMLIAVGLAMRRFH